MARPIRQIIGRLSVVGIATEPTRGTAVESITTLVPFQDYSLKDVIDYIHNDSALGNIAEFNDSVPYRKHGEGSIGGKVFLDLMGTELIGVFGDVPTSKAVQGQAGVFDHTFTMANDNSHQSLTIGVQDKAQNLRYALAMINSYKLEASADNFLKRTMEIKSKASKDSTSAINATYNPNDVEFVPENIKVVARNYGTNAGDASERTLNITSFSVTINKNAEIEYTMGKSDPVDIVNQQLNVEISFEGSTIDDSDRKAFRSGTPQIIEFIAEKSDVTIGTNTKPSLRLIMPKVSFAQYERSTDLNSAAKQTITGQANYDIKTGSILTAVIRNKVQSYR